MRKNIIAGNWKMHFSSEETKKFLNELVPKVSDAKCEVVVCPPFTSLQVASDILKNSNIKLGAQNIHFEEKGAFTGEISADIRKFLNESDQMDLALKLNKGESVELNLGEESILLSKENLLINMNGLEGYAFSGEGSIGVILDTSIDETLKEEGFVREIISKIQNLRKEKRFEVSDKIRIYIKNSESLINVIEKYKDNIKKETLTVDILFEENNLNYIDLNINGEILTLDILKI